MFEYRYRVRYRVRYRTLRFLSDIIFVRRRSSKTEVPVYALKFDQG
jgi:hypothetical protein